MKEQKKELKFVAIIGQGIYTMCGLTRSGRVYAFTAQGWVLLPMNPAEGQVALKEDTWLPPTES